MHKKEKALVAIDGMEKSHYKHFGAPENICVHGANQAQLRLERMTKLWIVESCACLLPIPVITKATGIACDNQVEGA